MRSAPRGQDDVFDLVLVGGGLANGLTALSTLAQSPAASIALVERGDSLGGNHTWCWHSMDAPPGAEGWLAQLRTHRWAGYDLRFPDMERSIEGEYAAMDSQRFHQVVSEALSRSPGCECLLGQAAETVAQHSVTLSDGRVLRGRTVIAATGPKPVPESRAGFQKFVGVEVELATDHGLSRPILMDASVAQRDGFRFMYVLPYGVRRLLVEDTVFSPGASLDVERVRADALEYAARFGPVVQIHRSEHGVLPMPFRDDPIRVADAGPVVGGYAGGYFHPGTGYSMPIALRFAAAVAQAIATEPQSLRPRLRRLAAEHAPQAAFLRRLNWMLFRCFEPDQMWHVLARFYRLPEPTIHRFYAMQLTPFDRARLLVGRPPRGFSLRKALLQGGRTTHEPTQPGAGGPLAGDVT